MAKSPRQTLEDQQRTGAANYEVGANGPYDVPHGHTPDEQHFPRHAASFHKLLQHELSAALSGGLPVAGLLTDSGPDNGVHNYHVLREGLELGVSSSSFDTLALNDLKLQNQNPPPPLRPRVLIDPRASKALSIEGADPVSFDVSTILYGASNKHRLLNEISFGSEETAAEIIELYAMALLRGFQFGHYAVAPDAQLALDALNSFADKYVWGYDSNHNAITAAARPVTLQNLFRGPTEGDLTGDYLSVFLTLPRPPLFPSGCSPDTASLIGAGQFASLLSQPFLVPVGQDQYFGVSLDDYVAIQNAEVPVPYPPGFFTGLTPIMTGRDIGNYVHVDSAYEEHVRAVDILTGNQVPRSSNSPYSNGSPPSYKHEGDGPTLGPPDAWGLVGAVRIAAERAAFAQKWLIARRARPEVMAGLIHLAMNGNAELAAKLPAVFSRPAVRALLDRVNQNNQNRGGGLNNYLLSQMYPEGSPAHPSWPSDHATIAEACVTAIKAIFDDCALWQTPTDQTVIVGQELDKLASNIALARDFAGVHFRSDGEHGIRLGEEVAIRFLQDHARTYREQFRGCSPGFTLTRRDSTRICITPDAVNEIEPCVEAAMAKEEIQQRFKAGEPRSIYTKENL